MVIESYAHRLLLLIAFFVVVAVIDYYRKGTESLKWKQYIFVLGCAAVFSLFGAVHDQITVSISKEYYTVGKGIAAENLREGVVVLGLKTGSYAGIVVSIVLLYFGMVSSVKSVARIVIRIGIWAFCFLSVGSVLGYISHVFGYRVLSNGSNAAFLTVWGWHIGLYLGAVLGLAYEVKKRKIT